MLSGWESLTAPGRDTNPSQVSSQQTLALIYLPRKDRKLSWLRRERRLHKYSNFGKAGDRTGDLVVGRQRSYQLSQPHPPKDGYNWGKNQLATLFRVRVFLKLLDNSLNTILFFKGAWKFLSSTLEIQFRLLENSLKFNSTFGAIP